LSQSVGITYKSKIPSFGDDASVVEAFRLYHYGIDNYSTGSPAADSIEGNFLSISASVSSLNTSLNTNIIRTVSASANPNIITPQTNTVVPLTIRGVSSQSANLLDIQNSSSTILTKIMNDGSLATSGYGSFGDISIGSTTALKVSILNASHKGITVKPITGQTENLQEWQNSTGTAISWVDFEGKIYQQGVQVGTGADSIGSFFLMGA
jgi:hypothetical protein